MVTVTKLEFKRRQKWLLFSLSAITVISLIAVMPSFLKLVEFLGQRIPQKDLRTDYLKGLAWAIFLGLTILIWPVRSQDKKALMWIWAVKCFVMLGLMLFYEYHYQTDAFAYFSVSRHDISQWKAMFSAGSNFPVSTIIWLQNIFFLNSFHAAKVSFGMIGLIAIYIFYRSAVAFLQKEKLSLLYFFAFFPSILFWSSILGKEPLVLFCITVYCYGVIKWIRIGSLSSAIIMLSGVVIAASLRPWLGFILGFPVFIITLPTITMKNFKTKIVVLLILIPIILFSTSRVMMSFGLKSIENLSDVANQKFRGFARGGSATEKGLATVAPEEIKSESVIEKKLPTLEPKKVNGFAKSGSVTEKELTIPEPKKVNSFAKGQSIGKVNKGKYNNLKDMLLFVPQGMFTVLFRPLPGEVYNVFGFLAGLEDTFLLILFVLAIKRIRWRRLVEPVSLWAILLITIWAAAYAFVSFNLGTVCRYRMQILPVFLGLLIYLAYGKNISNKMINTSK